MSKFPVQTSGFYSAPLHCNPTPEGAQRFTQIDVIRSASAQVEADLTATPDADLGGFDVRNSLRWQEAF